MKPKLFEMKKWDTHHHICPTFYVDAAKAGGFDTVYGMPWVKWSPKMMFNWMDSVHIEKAVMSISIPGVHFGDDGQSRTLCRQINDYMASMIQQHPHRLGGFASVPLPDVAGAVEELQYAMDTLKLDGIGLISNINGHYLGDPAYAPFYEAANQRKAVIYIHPAEPKVGVEYHLLNYTYYLKLDTAKTIMDFIRSGYHTKYPDIKFILSHGGGVLPAVCADVLDALEQENPNIHTEFDAWRGQLFADTALVTYADETFPTTLSFFGANHIVYGTDLCWAPTKYKYYLQKLSELNVSQDMFEKMMIRNVQAAFSGQKVPYQPFDIQPMSAKRVTSDTNYHVHHNPPEVIDAVDQCSPVTEPTRRTAGTLAQLADMISEDASSKIMLSMDIPEVWTMDTMQRRQVLQLYNDAMMALREEHPDTVGVLGVIDAHDAAHSIQAIDRCVNERAVDGLCLYVDIVGKSYDQMLDQALLDKLAQVNVPVVIHPQNATGVPLFNKNYYDAVAYLFTLIYQDHFDHLNAVNYIPTHTSGLLDLLSHPVNTMLYIDPKTLKPRIGPIIVDMLIKKIEPVHDYIRAMDVIG